MNETQRRKINEVAEEMLSAAELLNAGTMT